MLLILYPPSRGWVFPPAPIARVDPKTGGVRIPDTGVLGSDDSVTGAPERMKGEASECEADNLMAGVGSVVVASVVGQNDQGTPDDAPMEDAVPDAMDVTVKASDALAAAQGKVPEESHDKTREPMREKVLGGANMGMRALGDVVDTWERFAKYVLPLLTLRPRRR